MNKQPSVFLAWVNDMLLDVYRTFDDAYNRIHEYKRQNPADDWTVARASLSAAQQLDEYEAKHVALQAAHGRLRTALERHGRHADDCPAQFDPKRVGILTGNSYPCTCGFEAALTPIRCGRFAQRHGPVARLEVEERILR